jgi:dihydropteroate synthase
MVGIVNVTDDSFFDGGRHFSTKAAVEQGLKLVAEGASMLDIGGQSTRPGFEEISAQEEISRVVPVITELLSKTFVPLSVDTYKYEVAAAALDAGAHVLNDIFGLQKDERLAELAAKSDAAIVVMHNDPAFREKQTDPVAEVRQFFEKSIAVAGRCRLPKSRLILDPGIGFSKTQAQNLTLVARLSELRDMELPLYLGASRKSFIGAVLDAPAGERLEGTLATTALAVWQHVEFIRVHDVRANLRAAQVAAALRNYNQS